MRFAVIAVVAAAVLGGGVLQAQTANPPVTLATIAARNSGAGEAPVMLARGASPINFATQAGWRIWSPTGGSGWAIRDTTTRFLRFGYHATEATPRWFLQMHSTNAAALSSDFEVVLYQTSAPTTLYRFPLTGSSWGSTPVSNSQLSAAAERVSASEKTVLDGIPSSGGAWRFWLVDTTPSSGAIDWGRSGGAAWVRPPIGVSGLTVAARPNGLRVSWTAPTVTGGVDGFVVSVTPSGGSATDHVVSGTATSVDISNLTAGTSHSVTISAHYDLSASGRVSGPVSAAQSGTPAAPAPTDPVPVPPGATTPSAVTGVTVEPRPRALFVRWNPATGSVNQYRVTARQVAGDHMSRTYSDTTEKLVDGLLAGEEYAVDVAALSGIEGVGEGPASEPRTATPQAGAGEPDPDSDTEDVPVPALPLAGAGVLAGLLASAAYRLRRAGRRAHPGRRRSG